MGALLKSNPGPRKQDFGGRVWFHEAVTPKGWIESKPFTPWLLLDFWDVIACRKGLLPQRTLLGRPWPKKEVRLRFNFINFIDFPHTTVQYPKDYVWTTLNIFLGAFRETPYQNSNGITMQL